MIDLDRYSNVFDGITVHQGKAPENFYVDFLGTMTDARFGTDTRRHPGVMGGGKVKATSPTLADGEDWFEAVSWLEAARAARQEFTMITLGAAYGAQAVGACMALKALNPMPYRLVAVDADPGNIAWVREHFANNGIDAGKQWLIEAAVSDTNDPVYFPVGAPTSGAQNCVATNEKEARAVYFDGFVSNGQAVEALKALLLENRTGIRKKLGDREDQIAEIKMVSALTLADILGPLREVDLLESDIQQSEIIVFPPFMDLLDRRVRRVHIGTHGQDVHDELARMFKKAGWSIQFDFAPNGEYESSLGKFSTNDGILAATNPALS